MIPNFTLAEWQIKTAECLQRSCAAADSRSQFQQWCCTGSELNRKVCTGLEWTNKTGLDWTGLDWIGLDPTCHMSNITQVRTLFRGQRLISMKYQAGSKCSHLQILFFSIQFVPELKTWSKFKPNGNIWHKKHPQFLPRWTNRKIFRLMKACECYKKRREKRQEGGRGAGIITNCSTSSCCSIGLRWIIL